MSDRSSNGASAKDGSLPDTGQISVAELLKRNGQEGRPASGSRRRAGKGRISVAELTGELPIVRDSVRRHHAGPGGQADATASNRADAAASNRADAAVSQAVDTSAGAFETDSAAPDSASDASGSGEAGNDSAAPRTLRPDPEKSSGGVPAQGNSRPEPEMALLSGNTLAADLMRQAHARALSQKQATRKAEHERARAQEENAAAKASGDSDSVRPDNESSDSHNADRSTALLNLSKSGTYPSGSAHDQRQLGGLATSEVDLVKPEQLTGDSDDVGADLADEADWSHTGTRADTAGEVEGAEKPKHGPVRQWLTLFGQGVVAVIVGALLFKAFELLWEGLESVALVLAVLVILGLVAMVRILRKTDDIYSILIAVVVGLFITIGPLVFLLSTD